MDNNNLSTTIPEEEVTKLETILRHNDHPAHVDTAIADELFDHMKLILWKEIEFVPVVVQGKEHIPHNERKCSFCTEPAEFHNEVADMLACETCMYDIRNKEIDIMNPEDHPVSIRLRSILCDWADKHHYCCVDSEVFFGEYHVEYNRCFICHNTIERDPEEEVLVAIATGAGAIAHYQCAHSTGFQNYFTTTDYNEILSGLDLEERISDLDTTPHYTHPVSMHNLGHLDLLFGVQQPVDQSELMTHLRLFEPCGWIPTNRIEGCKFCLRQCSHMNPQLGILSCSDCLNVLSTRTFTDWDESSNKVLAYLKHVISNWLQRNNFHTIDAYTLFHNRNITHNRCNVCKDIILDNCELVAITRDTVTHITCAERSGIPIQTYHDEIRILSLLGFQYRHVDITPTI